MIGFSNYVNYSFLFMKLWGLNKLLLGVPYYIVEHLILSNIVKITYHGSKMLITGIGKGFMYIAFPKPITVLDSPNNNLDNSNLNSCDLDDKNNNHLDMYIDT